MPKTAPTLTDTAIKAMKYDSQNQKNNKKSGGKNLYILVSKEGKKWWRFDYTRPNGTRNSISIGDYSNDDKLGITLAKANKIRDEYNAKVKQGIDPSTEKQEKKLADKLSTYTLDKIFAEWLKSPNIADRAETTTNRDKSMFKNISPWLGSKHIKDIKKQEVIECLKRLDSRTGGESSRKLNTLCNQLWRYAVSNEYCEHNIIADIDTATVLKKAIKKNHSHITDTKILAQLLRDIDNYKGDFETVCSIKLAPLLVVRPSNISSMGWSEIDFDNALWTIPPQKDDDGRTQREGNRMKMNTAHTVPLSTQAIAILKEIQPLTGHTPFVFYKATTTDKHISRDTLSKALRSMGYQNQQTTHGFRHTASTLMNEAINDDGSKRFDSDFIEAVLAHSNGNKIASIYNKAQYLEQRRVLMQWWADTLDTFK